MADHEEIDASGQTIWVGDDYDGHMEDVLVDMTTGEDITIIAREVSNWTIKNIGFKGANTSGEGTPTFSLSDPDPDGESLCENVYLGDGAAEGNETPTGYGVSGFRSPHPDSGVHRGLVTIRNAHVANLPDNGMYLSERHPGTYLIDGCYAHDNFVSCYRITGNGLVRNSVAFNTDDEYDGRCVWVWPHGDEARLVDLDLDSGPYDDELHFGRSEEDIGRVDVADIYMEDVRYVQGINEDGPTDIRDGGGNGGEPDLTMPEGVPTSAEGAVMSCDWFQVPSADGRTIEGATYETPDYLPMDGITGWAGIAVSDQQWAIRAEGSVAAMAELASQGGVRRLNDGEVENRLNNSPHTGMDDATIGTWEMSFEGRIGC